VGSFCIALLFAVRAGLDTRGGEPVLIAQVAPVASTVRIGKHS
jgi:hypothetical protein